MLTGDTGDPEAVSGPLLDAPTIQGPGTPGPLPGGVSIPCPWGGGRAPARSLHLLGLSDPGPWHWRARSLSNGVPAEPTHPRTLEFRALHAGPTPRKGTEWQRPACRAARGKAGEGPSVGTSGSAADASHVPGALAVGAEASGLGPGARCWRSSERGRAFPSPAPTARKQSPAAPSESQTVNKREPDPRPRSVLQTAAGPRVSGCPGRPSRPSGLASPSPRVTCKCF